MITFFYTGAVAYKDAQTLAEKSTGGFVSSSTIQNGVPNNIFSDISFSQLLAGKELNQYIGLAGLYSDIEKAKDVKKKNITFELVDCSEEYLDNIELYISAAPLGGNTSSGIYMEKLQNSLAKPFHLIGGFNKLQLDMPITIEGVSVENGLGFWFWRKIKTSGLLDLSPCSEYWKKHDRIENVDFSYNIFIVEEDVVEIP